MSKKISFQEMVIQFIAIGIGAVCFAIAYLIIKFANLL